MDLTGAAEKARTKGGWSSEAHYTATRTCSRALNLLVTSFRELP
jgi:hypothetical protein